MRRTVATMKLNGEYRVIRDDKLKVNPYRLYHIWSEYMGVGNGCRERKKQIARFADLASCMISLADMAVANNQE